MKEMISFALLETNDGEYLAAAATLYRALRASGIQLAVSQGTERLRECLGEAVPEMGNSAAQVRLAIGYPEQLGAAAPGQRDLLVTMFPVDFPTVQRTTAVRPHAIFVPTRFAEYVLETTYGIAAPLVKRGRLYLEDDFLFSPGIGGLPPQLPKARIKILSRFSPDAQQNLILEYFLFAKVAEIIGVEHVSLVLVSLVGEPYTEAQMTQYLEALKQQLIAGGHISSAAYLTTCITAEQYRQNRRDIVACATHYLSMNLGCCWDGLALEAEALGIPVLVPSHTFYQEYFSCNTATMFQIAQRRPAEFAALNVSSEGASWASINLEAVVRIVASNLVDTAMIERKAGKPRTQFSEEGSNSLVQLIKSSLEQ